MKKKKSKFVELIEFLENLEELLDLTFIASEFRTSEGDRIDTVALGENGSPVIIEYKKRKDENIISQGLFYLEWLIDHKGDFEKVVEEKLGKKIKLDWSNPRLILIAEDFNKFDLNATSFISPAVELKKYRYYKNGVLVLEDIEIPRRISKIAGKKFDKLKKTISLGVYSLEEHLKKSEKDVKDIFYEMSEQIKAFDSEIEENVKKQFVAYKTPSVNFVWFHFQKNKVVIHFRIKKHLNDPKDIAKIIPEKYQWSKHLRKIKVSSPEEIGYAIKLIKQAYEAAL